MREPAAGTAAVSPDGRTISFTAGLTDDDFAYAISSADARSRAASVSITVPPPMTSRQLAIAAAAPFSRDDTYSTNPGQTLNVAAPGVLANDDIFLDTDIFTVQEGSVGSAGTLNVNDDGSFTYTPAAGFVGIADFQYRVITDDGNGNWATVTISVQGAPDANDDSYSVPATGTLTVDAPGLLANDSDVAGATVSLVSANVGPTITLNDDGSFTYTVGAVPFPVDSFTYRVTTPSGSDTATVTVSLSPPVLEDDYYQVDARETLSVGAPGILSNDVVSPTAAPTVSTGPSHGSLTLAPDGSFDYTPESDFVGSDSFTYAFANIAGVDTATVTIAVGSPLAVDDAYSTKRGATLVVAPPGVLSNDSADAGDVQLGTDLTEHGTLSLNTDGSFTYVPDVSFTGADTFSYATTGTPAGSNVATVTITVTPAPVAVDDAYSTGPDETLFVNASDGLLGNDIGATSVSGSNYTGSGSLGINNDGSFFYDPPSGFAGTETFTYTAAGPDGTSAPATVSVTVNADPPAAVDDSYSTSAGTTLTVGSVGDGVLGNDTDATSAALDTDVDHGTLTLSTDGTFTYTPDSGYTGTDTFTYTATGPGGTTEPATVTITVTPVDPPLQVAVDDAYHTALDETLTVDAPGVLGNDTGLDTASLVTDVTHGELSLDSDGGFDYTPDSGFSGTDTFTYSTLIGPPGSEPPLGTVTISVNHHAEDDEYSVGQDQTLTVETPGVLGNDQGQLTAAVVTDVSHGELLLSGDGGFVYTPDSGYTGVDTFTYTSLTGPPGSDPLLATVTITVNPATTAPVAVDDSYTVPSAGSFTLGAPGVMLNDLNAEGAAATLVSGPTHGIFTFNPDGSFSYSPDTEPFTGDSFTYRITGDGGQSAPATVTLTPEDPTGRVPVGNDDAYDVDEDETLDIDAPGVLGNDVGATGARLVSGTDHGSLDFDEDGSFSYIPDEDFTGTDEFVYVATNDVQVGQMGRSAGGLFALDSQPTTVTLRVLADRNTDDDDDDDDDADDPGDGSPESRDRDGDDAGVLPDTGSAVHPAHLTWAAFLTLTGGMLIARTRRRRGDHAA